MDVTTPGTSVPMTRYVAQYAAVLLGVLVLLNLLLLATVGIVIPSTIAVMVAVLYAAAQFAKRERRLFLPSERRTLLIAATLIVLACELVGVLTSDLPPSTSRATFVGGAMLLGAVMYPLLLALALWWAAPRMMKRQLDITGG